MTTTNTARFPEDLFDQPLTGHVIRTLLYADVFNYPLTAHEIFQNLTTSSYNEKEVQDILNILKRKKIVYQYDFFYSLKNDDSVCNSRRERNDRAIKYLKWAKRISKFISGFPFVRGIFLSGSLSKNCMDKDGDIDYFIVTTPGRLWLCRTLLILFKKLFLFNSYKFFCLNYFIDENHLEIDHKNIYTATEIVTLMPTYNKYVFEKFMNKNKWARTYRPNYPYNTELLLEKSRKNYFKAFFEWCLSGKIGDILERKFHKITSDHWKKKYRNFTDQDFQLSIQVKKHTSQINPENFQKRVILEFERRIQDFENSKLISLK